MYGSKCRANPEGTVTSGILETLDDMPVASNSFMLEKNKNLHIRRSSLAIYFNYSIQNSIIIGAWYFTDKF